MVPSRSGRIVAPSRVDCLDQTSDPRDLSTDQAELLSPVCLEPTLTRSGSDAAAQLNQRLKIAR
jgi:hypothetical protein